MQPPFLRASILIIACALAAPAVAHEFWVAPRHYAVAPGDTVTATLRVGRNLRGDELPYLTRGFHSFTVRTPDGVRPVDGLEGDLPALSYRADTPGLHVIAYHATPNEVRHDAWPLFVKNLAYEGLEAVAEAHRARRLPEAGFVERYARYAKALVQVGPVDPADRDAAAGAPIELVAEQNPYAAGLETLTVRLLRAGEPIAGRQVAIFRYDGAVTRRLVTTGPAGRAEIPLAGGGIFLLNAVDMQPVDVPAPVADGAVVWESQWASLTFGLPVTLPDLHPLDPLTPVEITRAIRAIGASGQADAATRVALVTLAEPDKDAVLAWTPGRPAQRKAFAIVRNGGDVFEAVIDIASGAIERWEPVPGVQPAISSDEWAEAQRLTKEDPRWRAAMAARGYQDVSGIFCESLSAGFFDLPEERGRRLIKMPCYDVAGARTNIYGRPIEGVISVVDPEAGEVVAVIDDGMVPVSDRSHEFGPVTSEGASEPVQPEDGRVEVDARAVAWGPWSFHLGFDQRFGPVLSLVRHADGEVERMVLYQGHLSEVFVPYMDADQSWYFRSYMDAGEYGLGALSSPLAPGNDCPAGATFLDADLVTPVGQVYRRERVVCVFERATSAPLWRHWEALNGAHAGQPATELIVRSIPTIGNYDYITDWVFTANGEIRIEIGATGIDAVKGVAVPSMMAPGADAATRTGMLVAPDLVAVHHDHFFSIRLDLDVDGQVNRFVRARLARETPESGPRRSLWRLTPVPMDAEGAVTARDGPEFWRIENPAARTALGHHPAYEIAVDSRATSLLAADDWPQRRAAFSGETLWITARRAGERFAGGAYPNQAPGGAGLPAYADGEAITETDLVAWATIGFHHLTRPEDWPVLPTVWHRLRLRPYGFFTRNPALAPDAGQGSGDEAGAAPSGRAGG